MTQRFNIGDIVHRGIDVDAADYNDSQVLSWYVIKIEAECVSDDYWIYKYHVRGSSTNRIEIFLENELRSQKEAELTIKLLPDRNTVTMSVGTTAIDQQLQVDKAKIDASIHQSLVEIEFKKIELEMLQKTDSLSIIKK